MSGLSRSNIHYMRQMAAAWSESAVVPQPVGQLPWGHVRVLLDKLDERDAREWYALAAVAEGWSRNVLLNQIKGRARDRAGAAPSNFDLTLPGEDSELAAQIAKDPYVFDFLGLSGRVAERELEAALVARLRDTLLELGTGFAFVGQQVHLDVGDDDYYIDLLFFNIPQVRYVVVELKIGKFEPEFAGKLGFYIAAVDDRLRNPARHAPTVGILMCADRNDTVVRYALGGAAQPMAVAGDGVPVLSLKGQYLLLLLGCLISSLGLRTPADIRGIRGIPGGACGGDGGYGVGHTAARAPRSADVVPNHPETVQTTLLKM